MRGDESRARKACYRDPVVAPASSAIDVDDLRMTVVARWRHLPMRIRLAAPLGDDDLFDLCAANRELRIERTTPGFLANERLRRVLFGSHPYAIIAPTEDQVASYTLDQLEDFYRQRYVPSDALLLIVGDFSAPAMLGSPAVNWPEGSHTPFMQIGTCSAI